MLPQSNRLKKRKDFDNVFKKGRGFKEKSLFLKIAGNNLKASRFGFVVGKSLSKKATVRNKIKRRLRKSIQDRLPKIKTGFDAVLVAQKGIEKEKFQDTAETIGKILAKAKLLC